MTGGFAKWTLSKTMREALLAMFNAADHRVRAGGGGFWEVGGVTMPWSTTTVYALEDRGLVRPIGPKLPRWQGTYALTGCGMLVAASEQEGRP